MIANYCIECILAGMDIKKDIHFYIDCLIEEKYTKYFSSMSFFDTKAVQRWVKSFMIKVKAGEVKSIPGSIESYYWNQNREFWMLRMKIQYCEQKKLRGWLILDAN